MADGTDFAYRRLSGVDHDWHDRSRPQGENRFEIRWRFVVFAATIAQLVVSIPMTIGALYFGEQIMGIEFSSMSRAFPGIAAIYCMVMGLDWVLTMFRLWPIVVLVVTSVVAFGLFMTLFDLVTWEVWTSIICIRIFATGVDIAFFSLVLGMA